MPVLITLDGLDRRWFRHLGVIGDTLYDGIAVLDRCVVTQHVMDETFLDSLAHRIEVIGAEAAIGELHAECFQSLGLGCRGKTKEGQVAMFSLPDQRLHQEVFAVRRLILAPALNLGKFLQRLLGIRQGLLQFSRAGAGLRRVCLIHDHGKSSALLPLHLLAYNWKTMQGRDDNPLAVVDGITQIGRGILIGNGGDEPGLVLETQDRFLQLPVEITPVCYYKYAVKEFLVFSIVKRSQAIRQPGDTVTFAAAGAVLDQVILTAAVGAGICHQLLHNVHLVVAREDQLALLPVAIAVLLQTDVALQQRQKTVTLEYIFPKVRGHIAVGVGRIACAAHFARAVAALIEWQEARLVLIQLRGHPHFGQVRHKIGQDTFVELEKEFPGIAVVHELQLAVFHALTGKLVFQFQRHDGDSVKRQHHIYRVVVFC